MKVKNNISNELNNSDNSSSDEDEFQESLSNNSQNDLEEIQNDKNENIMNNNNITKYNNQEQEQEEEEEEDSNDDSNYGSEEDNFKDNNESNESDDEEFENDLLNTRNVPRVMEELNSNTLEQLEKEQKRRGIIYLSAIPPRFSYGQLESIFGAQGTITHSYLAPPAHTRYNNNNNNNNNNQNHSNNSNNNKRGKKNKNKSEHSDFPFRPRKYVEGWIEFADRRVARRVAEAFNNTPFGGRNRVQREFLWNIRYVPGLRWGHLAQVMEKEADQEFQNLAQVHARREKRRNKAYRSWVHQAKGQEKLKGRKGSQAHNAGSKGRKVKRHGYQQRVPRRQDADHVKQEELASVFSNK